jgi:WD40 repeat protein
VSVAFSPDGKILATSGQGRGCVDLWDVTTGRKIATLTVPGDAVPYGIADYVIQSLTFSPDGRMLAAGSGSGSGSRAWLWDLSTRRLVTTMTGPSDAYSAAAVVFSPRGQVLAAVGTGTESVGLWGASSGRRSITLKDTKYSVEPVIFSPGGKMLASASAFIGSSSISSRVYLWHAATGRLAATLTPPTSLNPQSLAFSPDGKIVACASNESKIYLWDAASGHLATTLAGPTASGAGYLAFSPNGKTLAAIPGDFAPTANIGLFDVPTGHLEATLALTEALSGDALVTAAAAFSPDGKLLAVGALDGSTYLLHVG